MHEIANAAADCPTGTCPSGRPAMLDEVKRAEICAYVTAGCTYRAAAQFVECTVQAISALAKRDAGFAAQLRRAVAQREAVLLANLRQASKRSWRASAWLLEKTVGGRYGGKDGVRVETLEEEAEREAREMALEGLEKNSEERAEDRSRKHETTKESEENPDERAATVERGAMSVEEYEAGLRLDAAIGKLVEAWKATVAWDE